MASYIVFFLHNIWGVIKHPLNVTMNALGVQPNTPKGASQKRHLEHPKRCYRNTFILTVYLGHTSYS